MLHLYTSNRLENLVERLAGVMAKPLRSPFEAETVVVQSLGMRRWLSLELAERRGVCANTAFPFPQTFVHDIFAAVFPDSGRSAAFESANLTWRIMRLLPDLVKIPEFAEAANYLTGDAAELKRFQLAGKIAHALDQYFAFRPEMILEWDAGRERHWQAKLWRVLAKEAGKLHPPALGQQLASALKTVPLDVLPARVSLFGISSLPPFYVRLLGAMAERMEVHLFVLEPTPEWWGEIRSEREEMRLRRKRPAGAESDIERGNSLLASLGKAGRDFLQLLLELDPGHFEEPFEAPLPTTMLRAVQSDIFHLRDPDERRAVSSEDQSIQIHSCHSPMREMEVLQDQLLAMFERDPTLMPRDIAVMMPDVESYAPFIEAVFDTPEHERMRIPFAIADRGARSSSGIIDTFLRILDLAGTRLPVTSVVAVLEDPSVRQRFDLSESDLELITGWIRKTNIRWGIDAAHRGECGVPEFAQNSWSAGLERLLLGYALPAGGEQLFEGILPFDEIEGGMAETLGSFIDFARRLFATVHDLAKPRTLREWQGTLRGLLEEFFDPSGTAEYDVVQIRGVTQRLGEIARLSDFHEAVPLEVVRAYLAAAFEAEERNTGFLAGRVTFCALKPMRSIPFKIICLVGMNDTAFPRHAAAIGFDLIAQKPKLGDRTLRDDDRYLFLETVISARESLYISYLGRSIRDNSELPPSVLVSELLDYLAAHFEGAKREQLVTVHPLQPFSARYFSGEETLFSYSAENCLGSKVARETRSAALAFVDAPLPPPEADWNAVTLPGLLKFFRNPASFFLRERLGVAVSREDEVEDDREPFSLGALSRYKIAQTLTAKGLAGESISGALPSVRAMGELPAGGLGDSAFRTIRSEVDEFANVVKEHITGNPSPPAAIDLAIDQWRLTGEIEGLYGSRLLRYRCAEIKPPDLFATWISHLILNIASPSTAVLVGKEKVLHFPPEARAREVLRDLLKLYQIGLRKPLKLFPKTSLAFARHTLNSSEKNPRAEAEKFWRDTFDRQKGRTTPGEESDAAFKLAFRHDQNLLDGAWETIALRIFGPLFANCPGAAKP